MEAKKLQNQSNKKLGLKQLEIEYLAVVIDSSKPIQQETRIETFRFQNSGEKSGVFKTNPTRN